MIDSVYLAVRKAINKKYPLIISLFSTARKSDSWTFSADANTIYGGLFDNSSGVKSGSDDALILRDLASTISGLQ